MNYIITCKLKRDYRIEYIPFNKAIDKIESAGDFNRNRIKNLMQSGKNFQIITYKEVISFIAINNKDNLIELEQKLFHVTDEQQAKQIIKSFIEIHPELKDTINNH